MILRCPSGPALRERKLMLTSSKLLVLRVIRRGGIRLAGVLHSSRCQPGNHVGNFLVRHRLAADICAPVMRPLFGTASGYNRAPSLIAHQCQKRIIRDVAALWPAFALPALAGGALKAIR